MEINRRSFLKLSTLGAASLCLPSWAHAADVAARKPNFILIVADDLGYADIGVHGCRDIPTPHIDSIAKNGARFTSGYVCAPVCSPSRAGMLTGRYPQRFGYEFNPDKKIELQETFGIPATERLLPQVLHDAGYATGMVGKWHLGALAKEHPTQRGFDEFFGFLSGANPYQPVGNDGVPRILRGTKPVAEKSYLTDAFGREAVSFINRHRDQPYFLYLTFNAVHTPLEAPQKYLDRFPTITDPKRQKYAAMLSAMDDAIGSVLAAAEENTLVFFISDNGGPSRPDAGTWNGSNNQPLRDSKTALYEGGIRVPFLVQWPKHIKAGTVIDSPVISLDILPTACAVATATAPANVDGANLLPLLTKQNDRAPHDRLCWRYGSQLAIREGRWKLYRHEGVELYDLEEDIGETTNLAEKQPDKINELSAALEKWDAGLATPRWLTAPYRKPRAKPAAK